MDTSLYPLSNRTLPQEIKKGLYKIIMLAHQTLKSCRVLYLSSPLTQ